MENINYCRICARNNENEEEFTCLVDVEHELTDAGQMYEELLNVQIKEEEILARIIKICNSCHLQMKLFKDLKERAVKTLNFLHDKFVPTTEEAPHDTSLIIDGINTDEEAEDEDEDVGDEEEEEETYNVEYVEDSEITETTAQDSPRSSKEYYCNYCDINFTKRHEYLKHREVVHQNKYPCIVCGKKLNTKYSLRIHERQHGAEKGKYKCHICEKSYHQKVHLAIHLNIHNNVRQFQCEECGKSFARKSSLTVHMRIHAGDRRYECEVCGKQFLTSSHLKMHSFKHTGDRTFACDLCDELFISPATLRVHKNHLHNDNKRTFNCNICGKEFTRTNVLKTHYRTHRNELKEQQSSENDTRLTEEAVDDSTGLVTYSPEHSEQDICADFLIFNK